MSKDGYQSYLDWGFLTRNKKLYGLLVVFTAFNPNLVSLLPWMKSPVTLVTMGFPTLNLCYTTTWLLVIESVVLTAIYASFAVDEKHLFEQSAVQQFEFVFSISFVVLNGVVALIESLFLGVINERHESGNMELFRISVASNPILHDLESPRKSLYPGTEANNDMDIFQLKQTVKDLQEAKNQVDDRLKVLEHQKEDILERYDTVLGQLQESKQRFEDMRKQVEDLEEKKLESAIRFETMEQQLKALQQIVESITKE
jgi:hypothetical protein